MLRIENADPDPRFTVAQTPIFSKVKHFVSKSVPMFQNRNLREILGKKISFDTDKIHADPEKRSQSIPQMKLLS
jgi:hypothetical protein